MCNWNKFIEIKEFKKKKTECYYIKLKVNEDLIRFLVTYVLICVIYGLCLNKGLIE
jgi:hypothetical protein